MKEFPEGIFSLKNTLIHNHSHWLLVTNLWTRWCNYLIAHVGVTATLTMPVRKKFCMSCNTIGTHTRKNMEPQDQESWDATPCHCEDCRHVNLLIWKAHPTAQTDSKRKQKNNTPGMLMTGLLVLYNGKCRGVQWEKPKQLLFKEVRHFSDTTIKSSTFCVRLQICWHGPGRS